MKLILVFMLSVLVFPFSFGQEGTQIHSEQVCKEFACYKVSVIHCQSCVDYIKSTLVNENILKPEQFELTLEEKVLKVKARVEGLEALLASKLGSYKFEKFQGVK